MNIKVIKTIVINSIQKELRSKILWSIFALTVLFMLMTNWGFNTLARLIKESQLPLDIGEKKMMVFVGAMGLWSSFLGFYFGINSIKSDEESKVLPLFLSLPISRLTYVLARYKGSFLLVLAYYFISFIVAYLLFAFSSNVWLLPAAVYSALLCSCVAIAGSIFIGMLMSFFMNRSLSMLFLFFVMPIIFLINAHLSEMSLSEQWSDLGFLKILGLIPYYLLPRVGLWSVAGVKLISNGVFPGDLLYETFHFILTLVLGAGGFIFLFKRREY